MSSIEFSSEIPQVCGNKECKAFKVPFQNHIYCAYCGKKMVELGKCVCGNLLAPDANFCYRCGKKVNGV